jgi:DNA-binding response OmpR family regulator
LVKKQGRVASREEIIEFIDRGSDIFDRTIDSHVSHLRSKIRALTDGDILISAVYSLGYRLQAATDKRKE